MELLCVLLPLAALWLLCACLTLRGGLAPALAPLPVLAGIAVALTLCGVAGALGPGMWTLLVLPSILPCASRWPSALTSSTCGRRRSR